MWAGRIEPKRIPRHQQDQKPEPPSTSSISSFLPTFDLAPGVIRPVLILDILEVIQCDELPTRCFYLE